MAHIPPSDLCGTWTVKHVNAGNGPDAGVTAGESKFRIKPKVKNGAIQYVVERIKGIKWNKSNKKEFELSEIGEDDDEAHLHIFEANVKLDGKDRVVRLGTVDSALNVVFSVEDPKHSHGSGFTSHTKTGTAGRP